MPAQLHFGSGDSVTFGSLNGAGTGPSKSFNTSSLSNIQVGDLLVAWLGSQDSTPAAGVTAPSGWTRYGAPGGNPTWVASRSSTFWYYPLPDQAAINALPATFTWTFSVQTARGGFVVARASGVDLSHIEDSTATQFTSNSGVTSLTLGSIITANPNTLLVGGVYRHNSVNTTVPTCTDFMTAYQEYNSTPVSTPTVASTSAIMGYATLGTAGATGPYLITFDQSATSVGGELVAFKALDDDVSPSNPYVVGTVTSYAVASSVTSFTINKPSGLEDGDVLIMALSAQTPTATSDFTSSGWQRISQPFAASSGAFRIIAFYALPVPTATSITQTNFTFSSTDSASGGRVAAEMFIVRNADLNNLVDVYSPYGNTGPPTNVYQPSTTVANDLMLAAYNAQFVANLDYTVASGPSGMSLQNFVVSSTTAAQSKTTLAVYKQPVPTAGTATAASLTWNGAMAQASGVSIAIRPLGGAPANDGLDIQYTSATDTLTPAKLFYTSATNTLTTPLELRPVPSGYSSVSTMLAEHPFYVAHRGGSVDWPEMSLHGYTQSVFWGMGAVEVSLARTSDGVWFGLHDASLDRTSLGSGGGSGTSLIAANMTWAQVQAYQIQYPGVVNSSSSPQPYMRWEELMDAYYATHVIFVDPKVASSYINELLAMMDAMPGTPTDRFIGKYYGVAGNVGNTSGWAYSASLHGYKTWGYFYQTDYANVPTYQGRWDILGMDYTADQASWTQILSYNKPVIGHIVPTSAAATTALGYGASGLMVSGVQAAVPRSPNPSQA